MKLFFNFVRMRLAMLLLNFAAADSFIAKCTRTSGKVRWDAGKLTYNSDMPIAAIGLYQFCEGV